MEDKINWVTICVAILVLGAIEIVALLKGINGTIMALIVAAIAGLVGWQIPTPKEIVKN